MDILTKETLQEKFEVISMVANDVVFILPDKMLILFT